MESNQTQDGEKNNLLVVANSDGNDWGSMDISKLPEEQRLSVGPQDDRMHNQDSKPRPEDKVTSNGASEKDLVQDQIAKIEASEKDSRQNPHRVEEQKSKEDIKDAKMQSNTPVLEKTIKQIQNLNEDLIKLHEIYKQIPEKRSQLQKDLEKLNDTYYPSYLVKNPEKKLEYNEKKEEINKELISLDAEFEKYLNEWNVKNAELDRLLKQARILNQSYQNPTDATLAGTLMHNAHTAQKWSKRIGADVLNAGARYLGYK